MAKPQHKCVDFYFIPVCVWVSVCSQAYAVFDHTHRPSSLVLSLLHRCTIRVWQKCVDFCLVWVSVCSQAYAVFDHTHRPSSLVLSLLHRCTIRVWQKCVDFCLVWVSVCAQAYSVFDHTHRPSITFSQIHHTWYSRSVCTPFFSLWPPTPPIQPSSLTSI